MQNKKEDRSTWAIGGGVVIGLGLGFFLLPISALYFVGSLLAGLGGGIVASAAIYRKNKI
jgi:hypothetical protein